MCSGGSGPTSSTSYTSNVPSYLQPYATQLAGQGAALTNPATNPYQSYIGNQAAGGQGIQGTTVAGLTPMQQQAMQGMQGMSTAPQLNQATGMTQQAAGNVANGMPAYTGANVQQYMSPYQQNVTQQLSNQAIQNYANSLPQLGSTATNVGGLGGSREALLQAQAQQGLQQNLANIQATGAQNAFQNAQQQFNTQNQMNLAANQQLLGAGTNMANIGQTQYGQQMGILSGLLGAGTQQQQLAQNVNNALNQNFQNQINYPYAQQAFLSGILHGTSPGALGQQGTTQTYAQPANALGQIAGVGAGLAGLAGTMGSSSGQA